MSREPRLFPFTINHTTHHSVDTHCLNASPHAPWKKKNQTAPESSNNNNFKSNNTTAFSLDSTFLFSSGNQPTEIVVIVVVDVGWVSLRSRVHLPQCTRLMGYGYSICFSWLNCLIKCGRAIYPKRRRINSFLFFLRLLLCFVYLRSCYVRICRWWLLLEIVTKYRGCNCALMGRK